MLEVNLGKESAKNHLIPNITGSIANVQEILKEVQYLMVSLNYTIGGAPSGADTRLIGYCQRAINDLDGASGQLHRGLENAEQLNTMDWVTE